MWRSGYARWGTRTPSLWREATIPGSARGSTSSRRAEGTRRPRRDAPARPLEVGLVSDTHDHVDPQLAAVLEGCDLVLHAGDVTREPVLAALAGIAPVHAARGNNDIGPFGASLPELLWVELGALTALVVHELGARSRFAPAVARAVARREAQIVVHGHSHRPAVSIEGGRLVVNPGSAGRRRFSLPRSAARMRVEGRLAEVTLYDLAVTPAAPIGDPFRALL